MTLLDRIVYFSNSIICFDSNLVGANNFELIAQVLAYSFEINTV